MICWILLITVWKHLMHQLWRDSELIMSPKGIIYAFTIVTHVPLFWENVYEMIMRISLISSYLHEHGIILGLNKVRRTLAFHFVLNGGKAITGPLLNCFEKRVKSLKVNSHLRVWSLYVCMNGS